MEQIQFSDGREVTNYSACAVAEGFCEGEGASIEDQMKAWSHLIKTGLCWNLQGWYGRTANSLIENGIIAVDGTINWEKVNNLD